jgi:hypothetical protein
MAEEKEMKWFWYGFGASLILLAVMVIRAIYNDYKDIKGWRESE